TAHEPRPGRHRDRRVDPLRQETPELWMVPAQIVAAGVAMRADALSQPPDLGDQLVAAHSLEIVIKSSHGIVPPAFHCRERWRNNHGATITWTGRASRWHLSEGAPRRSNPARACPFSGAPERCAS